MDQHTIHACIRYSHIAVGSIAIVLFWFPVFAKKGQILHIRSGRLFVCCAYYVSATAAVSCTWALIDPLGFTGILRELTDDELRRLSVGVRFLFAILGTLMTWLVASLQMGLHVVRHRSAPNQPARFARMWWMVAGLASTGLMLFGLVNLRFDEPNYLLPATLGLFGILDARKNLTYLKTEPPSDMSWLYMHMECMLGSGIALYTAFFVFGFSRLLPFKLQGPPALIPWILPAAIGIPTISLWTNYYKRKFGELPNDSNLNPHDPHSNSLRPK